jgi:hypothetical protein
MSIITGIDPHKATHTAVAVDHDENVINKLKIRASKTQTRRLCEWAGLWGLNIVSCLVRVRFGIR